MTTENATKPTTTGEGAQLGPQAPAPAGRQLLTAIAGGIPTLLVLAALGALAWWGHRTGWKVPKFAQLTGTAAAERKEDWCAEHNVPDSICIACHPELAGGNPADWCKEHGVPESKCTVCHPEILTTGVAGDWCREHGVPESACPVCHEEIAVRGPVPGADGDVTLGPATGAATRPAAGQADDHFKPDMSLVREPATRPGKDPRTCQTHARRVQFASAESVAKAGVKLAAVAERPMSATLTANAETQYDRTRFAQVASPVGGRVWRVDREIGRNVSKGELLALVDSAEVGKAKADLLEATAALDLREKSLRRIRESAEKGFRTEAEQLEAEAGVKEARIKLFNAQQALANLGMPVAREELEKLAGQPSPQAVQFLGLPQAVVRSLDPKAASANLVPIFAPLDGVIVERNGIAGEMVEPFKPLFSIADTSRLWVTMDLPVAEARRVKLGQAVTFFPDGARDHQASGEVSWVSTAVDDQTRTVRVRADVGNPGAKLLALSFGRAVVTIRQTPNAIVVPSEAVQWEGCCYVAFVRLSDTVFQTRKLRLGSRSDGHAEVIVGVLPGEVVVTAGSHVLKSEILKANLGAGCTDE